MTSLLITFRSVDEFCILQEAHRRRSYHLERGTLNITVTPTELKERLDRFPRVSLAHLPTPLEPCPRLTEALSGPRIFIKREDCTGLAFGGNKTRILEYVLGKGVASGADCVVQGAAEQSNHCRQLASAAVRLGLKAHLVLHKYHPSREVQGNLLLDHLLGAEIHLTDAPLGKAMEAAKQEVGEQLRQEGHNPFVISEHEGESLAPLAYVDFILELQEQLKADGVQPDFIYCSSAGATQSGMVLGARALGLPWQIIGIAPIRWDEDIFQKLARTANTAAKTLDLNLTLGSDDFVNDDGYIGESYGKTSQAGLEALKFMARTEGIILDPMYTAKALAGLVDHIRKGRLSKNETVIFVHTGGTPALFAYNQEVLESL